MDLEAVVLAGGFGSRLKSVVSDRPKPMALVGEKPFLEWILLELYRVGIRRVILSIGYLGEQIQSYFEDGKQWNVEISYSRESKPLGTGGAIQHALPYLQGESFLVLNGDSLCQFEPSQLLEMREQYKAGATIWLAGVENSDRYGSVELNKNHVIVGFHEKSTTVSTGLINAGVYLLERKIFSPYSGKIPLSIERDIFPALVGSDLYGVIGNDIFIDIGTPDSYRSADSFIKKYYWKN
ncbi:MAG: nucleotidyltransferase family protein [Cyanobacteria bacterium SBLK]|nr:nucleotidyltransferase family protein [Cyanobacteria bacterium SBLK]